MSNMTRPPVSMREVEQRSIPRPDGSLRTACGYQTGSGPRSWNGRL
jgi:hypothetical protein